MCNTNYQALLAEKRAELGARKLYQIYPNDEYIATAAKLLKTYGYCEFGKLNAIPLFSKVLGGGVEVLKLKEKHLQNSTEEVGLRGGTKMINPVSLWLKSKQRINVAGQQMRPDQPRPLFTDDDGNQWANVYCPTVYDSQGGDPRGGIEFLEYLLPDQDERRWFTQWLSYKVQNPHVPGVSVIMVARDQGTGRGTLSELCARLLGRPYVLNLGFDLLSGKSGQSQFNEWNAGSLLVCVAESSKSDGGSSYKAKADGYETLKEVCEPRSIERYFSVKFGRPFTGRHHTSFLISSNHADALPIDRQDRRFAILTNGDANKEPRYWETLNDWMAIDANIGAFSNWLFDVDLSGYSPYAAPAMTEGKAAMIEAGLSDIDRALVLALEEMDKEVFTALQIINRMRALQHSNGFEFPPAWRSVVTRLVQKHFRRVGVLNKTNWKLRIGGVLTAVYAKDKRTADKWKLRGDLREQVLKGETTVQPGQVLEFARARKGAPAGGETNAKT
jgi:Family of unknown function (DUF5906)